MSSPKPIPSLSEDWIARYSGQVEQNGPDECWPWKGSRFPSYIPKKKRRLKPGYGKTWIHGKAFRAHRVALYLATGIQMPNKLACHTCDNVICCNPAHLFLGTQKENMEDCVSKGRQAQGDGVSYRLYPEARPFGERSPLHKLSTEQVLAIVTYSKPIVEQGRIRPHSRLPKGFANQVISHFNLPIGPWMIRRILTGKAWGHLRNP